MGAFYCGYKKEQALPALYKALHKWVYSFSEGDYHNKYQKPECNKVFFEGEFILAMSRLLEREF